MRGLSIILFLNIIHHKFGDSFLVLCDLVVK